VPVAEQVLELEVTSNRPDCLGVWGVAREVHAISDADLSPAPWEDEPKATGEGKVEDLASIEVKVPELCPRFTARVFTGVEVGPSPLWLKARLIAAGQRPINNVVDITNTRCSRSPSRCTPTTSTGSPAPSSSSTLPPRGTN